MKRMIKIGLPKGGVKDKSLNIVEQLIGKSINREKLSFINDVYSIFLLKHRDIPKMVEEGILDVGITTTEWIEENENLLKILATVGWCDTNICLIGSANKNNAKQKKLKCVTEFPCLAKKYFEKMQVQSEIYHISGSSEACVPDIFDYCVDCVETGRTLQVNELTIESVIMQSRVLIVVRNDKNENDRDIQKLIDIALHI